MNLTFLIPLGLGVISVIQGGLNRRLASETNLQGATLINCIVLLATAFLFYFWKLPPSNAMGAAIKNKGLLLLIPGVLGFFLVTGIPWAIGRWGASFVFVWIIGSQMTSGLLWDVFFESKSIQPLQLAGAGLSILGALCFSLKS